MRLGGNRTGRQISLAVRRKLPGSKTPHYIFAQVLGAFTAAALVYWN